MKAPVDADGLPDGDRDGLQRDDTIQTNNTLPNERSGMSDFTLFELHFHDGIDIGPSSIGSRSGGSDGADALDAGDADEEDESSGLGKAVGVLVVVAVLVALAVGAKKLLSDDLEPIEELEDLDDEI